MKPAIRTLLIAGAAGGLVAGAEPARGALGAAIVKDPWNIAQTTETVRRLAEQYRTMLDQVIEARRQVGALTSHSGFGTLLDGPAERAARRYLPDAWSAATDLHRATETAAGAVDATRAAIGEAQALYRPASAAEVDPYDAGSAVARRYEREVGTALAVLAGSRVILDDTARRRDAYETLMARIEVAPDAKAAADLANRLTAENGLASNELVRATAMQAHLMAVAEIRLAAARATSVRAARRTRVNLSGGSYARAS